MPDERAAIGIDLGHSNVRVSIWRDDLNRAQVIQNGGGGNSSTPACIAFADAEPLIGEGALGQMEQNPTNTVLFALRLVGRRYDDDEAVAVRKRWPFNVVAGPDGAPLIEATSHGATVQLQPEQIISMLLTKARNIAEAHLGEEVRTFSVFRLNAYRKGPVVIVQRTNFSEACSLQISTLRLYGVNGSDLLSKARSVFPTGED